MNLTEIIISNRSSSYENSDNTHHSHKNTKKKKKSGWAFVSTFYIFRPTTLNFQFFFLMTIASTSGFHQFSFLLCFFPPFLGFSIVTFLMDDERVESREFWAVVGGGS